MSDLEPYKLSVDQVKDVAHKTIFPNSTDAELEYFLLNCQRLGVHPLSGLLSPVKRTSSEGSKVLIYASYRFFLEIAKKNPYFISIQPVIVYEKDKISFKYKDGKIQSVDHQSEGFNQGGIVGAYATVHYKDIDNNPQVYFFRQSLNEASGSNAGCVWKSNQASMMTANTIKRALIYCPMPNNTLTSMKDLYEESEVRVIAPGEAKFTSEPDYPPVEFGSQKAFNVDVTDEELEALRAEFKSLFGGNRDQIKKELSAIGIKSISSIRTKEELKAVWELIINIKADMAQVEKEVEEAKDEPIS